MNREALYREKILPNTETIIATANQRFYAGEINYLNWVMLINEGISVKNQYLEIVEELNHAGIQIDKIRGTANN